MPGENRNTPTTTSRTTMKKHRNRPPGGQGLGKGGRCVCTHCGYAIAHERGVPCNTQICPKCKEPLDRVA